MIIEEVELHNIRSYKDARIPFKEGTILFQGDIGSGKSTILMAIDFALFGTSDRDTYEKLLRKGERESYVRVRFRSDGNQYEIYRSVEKTKRGLRTGESYLLTPQGRRPVSPLEIKSLILSLLGVEVSDRGKKSHPIVKYAIYTPQEMMKEILSSKSDERLKVMRRIFRIDEYETARNNAKIVTGNINGEIGKLEGLAESLEGERTKLEEMRGTLEERKNAILETQRNLESLRNVLEEKEHTLRELNSLEKSFQEKSNALKILKAKMKLRLEEMERLRKELQDIESKKGELQRLETASRRYDELKAKSDNLKADVDKLPTLQREHAILSEQIKHKLERRGDAEKLREEIRRLREEMKKLKSSLKLEKLENESKELDDKIHGLRVQYEKLRESIADLKREREEYEQMSVCPKCKRPLDEEQRRKLILETEEEMKKKEANMAHLESKIEMLSRQLDDMRKAVEEQRNIDRRLSQIQSTLKLQEPRLTELEQSFQDLENLQRRESKISAMIKNLEKVKIEYDNVTKAMRELEPKKYAYNRLLGEIEKESEIRNRLDGIDREVKDMKKDVEKLEDEIERLNYEPETLEKARRERDDAFKNLTSLEENLRHLEREKDELQKNIESMENEIAERVKKVEKLDALRKIKDWLQEDFILALEEIEKVRMNIINEEFKMLFEEWFHELLGDSEYEATVDEYFEPIIRYQNFDMPLTTLSGGERTSVALAYRLALNTMVKRALGLKTSILILDEPTEGFSKDQLYKLKDIFDKMETDQIIIVTHEKELVNLADVVYLVEKINGESRVTVMQGA